MTRAVRHGRFGLAEEVRLDATDTSGDVFAPLVTSSWQIVHQFRNILLAARCELPAERIRGVHDGILRRVQSLIEHG